MRARVFGKERLLSISSSRLAEKELEEKVSVKVDERVGTLRRIIADYATENQDLRRRIQQTEDKLSEIEGTLAELKKTLVELQVDS